MISETRIGAIHIATIYRTKASAQLDSRSQASPLLRPSMLLIRQIILYIYYLLSSVWTVLFQVQLVAPRISQLTNASQKYKSTASALTILTHIQVQVATAIVTRLNLQLYFLTIAPVRHKMKQRSFC